MPRAYSAGNTAVPNQRCSYYKNGTLRYEEYLPAATGGQLSSQFTRAPAINNPINNVGWRKPSNYYGSLTKHEVRWVKYNYLSISCSNYLQPPIPIMCGLQPFPNLCGNDLARARNKALLELKDQTINLSLAFKERQQTVDLVAGAIRNALGVFKKAKSILKNPRRLRALRSQLKGKWKEVPEAWLLYRYGIVPTMLDAYGAADALEKRDNGTYDRYMITIRGKSTTVLKPKLVSHYVSSYGRYFVVPNVVSDQYMLDSKYGARVRYDAALTNSTFLRLSEVGVTNPLEVAWELLSFSFVADWFLSIGDWCSALDATLPFTFIGGSETIFVEWSGETRVTSPHISVITDSGPATHKQFKRTAVGSFPSASPFVLKQDPINLTRLADALSLMATFARRDTPPLVQRVPYPKFQSGIQNGS